MTYTTRFQFLFDKARDIAHAAAMVKPRKGLPPLFFVTDPERTPHPEDITAHLPAGCGVIYRHFGEGHALQRARLLRQLARDNGLVLLIGEDDVLAAEIEADGVHLRQHSLQRGVEVRAAHPEWVITGACHDRETLVSLSRDSGLDALFISPVFASPSASAQGVTPLGDKTVREWAEASALPLYGLGGITCDTVTQLHKSGLAGVGAVEAFRLF